MTDEERTELEALRKVADAAAFVSIDLASNLSSVHEAYLRGDITRRAYEYVLMRHASLLIALYNAGYVEQQKPFNFPIKLGLAEVKSDGFSALPCMDWFSSPALKRGVTNEV